jgi:hypothetical protein
MPSCFAAAAKSGGPWLESPSAERSCSSVTPNLAAAVAQSIAMPDGLLPGGILSGGASVVLAGVGDCAAVSSALPQPTVANTTAPRRAKASNDLLHFMFLVPFCAIVSLLLSISLL